MVDKSGFETKVELIIIGVDALKYGHMNQFPLKVRGEQLILLPEKAIFWPDENVLFVSDIHLGKSSVDSHHIKGLNNELVTYELERISALILKYKIKILGVTGDMFHRKAEHNWQSYLSWRNQFPKVKIELAVGNHDSSLLTNIQKLDVRIREEIFLGPFQLQHYPAKESETGKYILAEHLHPVILVNNKVNREKAYSPCFVVGEQRSILPAFGTMARTGSIQPKQDDRLFVVESGQISEWSLFD